MKSYFLKLYKQHRELVLLEWAYAAVSLATFLIAGVLALINQSLGVALLIIPLIAFVTCTVNVVTWALIKLVADHLIEGKKHEKELPGEIEEVKPKTKKKAPTKKPTTKKKK